MTFELKIDLWTGVAYEAWWPDERIVFDADTVEEGIAQATTIIAEAHDDLTSEDEVGSYDMRVNLYKIDPEDDDPCEADPLYSDNIEWCRGEEAQASMEETWEVGQDDFSTDFLGVRDGQWFTWRNNGGSRGAYDRWDQNRDKWVEEYAEPRSADEEDAIRTLFDDADLTPDEIIAILVKHCNYTKDEAAKLVNGCLGESDCA